MNNNDLVFSSLKVKKIIQENKEIGKIANMSPYVISKSLEYFIKDIIADAAENTTLKGQNTIQSINIKNIVNSKPSLSFLSDLVSDVEESKSKKKNKKDNSHPNINIQNSSIKLGNFNNSNNTGNANNTNITTNNTNTNLNLKEVK